MNTLSPKRAGGEKRGSKYDRAARLSSLSLANGDAPIIAVELPWRARRVIDGRSQWVTDGVTRTFRFRAENYCAHCNGVISCDAGMRDDAAYAAQQDRIDPDGGYTLDNLQLLCPPCNKAKSDRFIG